MAAKVGEIYYDVTLELDQMIKDQRRVATETQKVSGTLSEMGAKVRAVAAAVGVFVAATKLLAMAKLADEVRMLAARVQVAAGSIEAGAQAMRELEAISIRTRSSIEANADVFSRLNQSILQMGGTQKDTLQLTELLGKGIAASGAKGQEAEAAMRQFGQAMGTGKLSGDELNSMMENSQYLMQKLAQGLGVPVGALKKLGADGKLTADVLLKAFEKMSAQIDEDFNKLPPTIESAAVVAKDAAARLAKALDDVSNGSAAMAGVLKGAGTALDALTAEIIGTAGASDDLGRNKAISEWASTSVTAMSYLIGAADTVWQTISVLGRNVAFVFKGIGTEIGGIGAQVAAVMRGDFAGAAAIGDQMKVDAAERRRELEAADAATLNRQNYGEAMRQRLEKKPETRSAPSGVQFSSLTPPADPEVQKRLDGMRDELELAKLSGAAKARLQAIQKLGANATAEERAEAEKLATTIYDLNEAQKKLREGANGEKFDSKGYLLGLSADAAVNELAKIDAEERKALSDHEKLLKERKLKTEEYEQGVTLIKEKYAIQRAKLDEDVLGKFIEKLDEAKKANEDLARQAQELGNALTESVMTPLERLNAELAKHDSLLASGVITQQTYTRAAAKARKEYQENLNQMDQFSVRFAQNVQDQLGDTLYNSLTGNFKDIGTAWGQMLLKMASQAAAADISRFLFGGLVTGGNGSGVLGSALSSVGSFLGISGGRANGGGVGAGKMYEVNERGDPELLNVGNKQLLMMAGQSGTVSPLGAGQVNVAHVPGVNTGAGGPVTINFEPHISIDASGNASVSSNSGGANTDQLARQLNQQMQGMMTEFLQSQIRPGGVIWRLQNGR